ncbi:MAG TPA: alpha-amylase family glycosyl hydrolase [Parafilimonas sp.]|nr:alpha-amylase family glycosyl hydrolase [Parafilimonas sp.]
MRKIIRLVFCICSFIICNNFSFAQKGALVDGHPAWILQGNIYEVNVRQYTPEGTFKAFEKSLPRLKQMGVQTLWFMPINPISKVDRKGTLGSYYAVSNYKAINPEFGTMDDWKSLVKMCHDMGFKVIMDWVPNHTGADNYWLTAHPDFYVQDSTGKAVSQFDWTDTRKLNYHNPVLEDTMIQCMKFWIDSTNIDGFRCDYAVGPTKEFWTKCIDILKADKNVFMLAETDSSWLLDAGFDAVYTWPEFNVMKKIAAGKSNALALDSLLKVVDATFPANGLLMYFTSNHDENSWNGADYKTMPGASHAPFAVLTQTLPRSIPEIYSGQEEPFLDSISFFYKDTITFHNYARAKFYSTLLHLREAHAALAANASFKKIQTNNDEAIYAFERMSGSDKIIVIVNLTNQPQDFLITDNNIVGNALDVFTQKKEKLVNNTPMHLNAWDYKVYSFK